MWPALISAGASLLGGLMGQSNQDSANQVARENAAANIALQREFAQNSLQWKAEDARKAGIHPIYAMGASGASFSPVTVTQDSSNPMGQAVASMGQDLSRAVNATRTGSERDDAYSSTVKSLTLTRMGLENEVLSSQIAKLRQTPNPPMPSLAGPVQLDPKTENAPQLHLGDGTRISHDPTVSNVEDYQKRYGEPAEWVLAPYVAWRDFNHHNKKTYGDFQKGVRKRFGDPPQWLRNLTGEN